MTTDRRGNPIGNRARNGRQRRRDTIAVTFRGETLPLTTWAHRLGLSRKTLDSRLRYGWPIERVLTEPARVYRERA